MLNRSVVRKVGIGALAVLASVTLAACGSGGPAAVEGTTAHGKPIPGSVINADVHLGPKVSCLGHSGVPARICAAWKKLSPAQRQVLSGPGGLFVLFPISVSIRGRYATATYCSTDGMGAWQPVHQSGLASGAGAPTLLPVQFSCAPYLDPSGGGLSGEVIAGIVVVVVVVIAGVLVAVLRRKPQVRAGVLSAPR